MQNLARTEDKKADVGTAPSAASKTTNTPANVSQAAKTASWTLEGLNNAEWYDAIGKGQFPVYARAHVMLNNAHASRCNRWYEW